MLTLEEFLAYWIPILYKVKPGKLGYRKASIDLLSHLTNTGPRGVAHWVDKRSEKRHPPDGIIQYLNAIHIQWLVEKELAEPSPNIEKIKALIGHNLKDTISSILDRDWYSNKY